MSERTYRLLLLGAVLVGLALRVQDLHDPWSEAGWHALGAQLSNGARNLAEHGWLELRLAPTLDGAPPLDGESWRFYTHHPPLLVLVLAAAFEVFGAHEHVARLVVLVASLGTLLGSTWLARRLWGRRQALVAAWLMATLPVTAFYGTLVDGLGPLLVALVVLSVCCWWHALESPTRGRLLALSGALFLAGLANWQGIEAAGLITAVSLVQRRWRFAVAAAWPALAVLALFVAQSAWVRSGVPLDTGSSLVEAFVQRSWGGLAEYGGALPAFEALGRHLRRLYGGPVLLLALVGLLTVRRTTRPTVLLTLLGYGVIDMLVFLEGSARHAFWNALIAPATILLAAAGLMLLSERLPRGLPRAVAVGVVTLGLAGLGAADTLEEFERGRSTYSRDLGLLIAEKTDPDDLVMTCEALFDPLRWYARRRLFVGVDDRTLERYGLKQDERVTVAVVPRRAHSPHEHTRVEAALRKHYPLEKVFTEELGTVLVFDLSRKRRTLGDDPQGPR